MRRKPFLALAGGLLVIAGAVGHGAWWYLPRVRAASPQPDSPVAALLHADAYPLAVWVPYPHQNLAALERATANAREVVKAVARVAELPRPVLPAFGPLPVPPASEMAIAVDEEEERFAVCARVYPTVAVFARLAGRLAGNPWLRGGEAAVDGRRVEVTWQGNVWTVSSGSLPSPAAPPPGPPPPPSLVVVHLRRSIGPLPAGRFYLERAGADLELRSAVRVPAGVELAGQRFSELGLFLLLVNGRGEDGQALAFFSQDDRTSELPRAAVLYAPGAARWKLPGEGILDLSGREPRPAVAAGVEIAALDRVSLERAQRLAPELAPLPGEREDGLALGLWIQLDGLRAETSRIVAVLEQVPLVSRRRLERWRDAETVLAPLAGRFSQLSLVITEEPAALRLRLIGRGKPAPPG